MHRKITYLAGAILSLAAFAMVSVGIVSAKESITQNNEVGIAVNEAGQNESYAVQSFSESSSEALTDNVVTLSTGQVMSTAGETQNTGSVTVSYTSSDSTESSPIVETWVPQTAEEKKYYSYVGTEKLKIQTSGDAGIKVANSVQGPLCHQVFESVLGDYSIARTYNIFPGVYNLKNPVYELDNELEISIEIPKSLQKDGRTFEMICVSKGKPYVLKDLDSDGASITIRTKYFYAYALCYKDQ